MAQATISKNYRVPIPREILRLVPLKPGQSVQIEARDGVITLVPGPVRNRAQGRGSLPERPLRSSNLAELAAARGVRPLSSLASIPGGWPKEDRDDGFEDVVRRWRDHELEHEE